MVNCLIVYFSQMGSTAEVANSLSDDLREQGWSIDMVNLAEDSSPMVEDYDVLGIGTPTFFFRPPALVTEFVDEIPPLEGRPFFVFALYSLHVGDTGNDIRERLAEKGGSDIGYLKIRGTNHFPGYTRKGILFCPENPTEAELDIVSEFASSLFGRYQDDGLPVQELDPKPPRMYRLERVASRRWLTNNLLSRTFSVDEEACISCGKCVSVCPTENIHLHDSGIPKWGHDCILCLSCEITCPEDAISCILDSRLMGRIIDYNITKGIEDPCVEFKEI
jgi:flavodoxin/NAD-dependent dihydropyrimidine dehydrogenase PreA subunit